MVRYDLGEGKRKCSVQFHFEGNLCTNFVKTCIWHNKVFRGLRRFAFSCSTLTRGGLRRNWKQVARESHRWPVTLDRGLELQWYPTFSKHQQPGWLGFWKCHDGRSYNKEVCLWCHLHVQFFCWLHEKLSLGSYPICHWWLLVASVSEWTHVIKLTNLMPTFSWRKLSCILFQSNIE